LSLLTVLTLLLGLGLHAGLASAAPGSRIAPHNSGHKIGDPIAIPDMDGNEIGTVTVTDFEEDFTDFSERAKKDLQYISVGLAIENTGDDPIQVEPGNIAVIDDAGLIYTDIEVTRDDNADELASSEIDSGDTLEGFIEIGFPADRDLAQLVWVVGQGQLLTLINNADPVEVGDTVTLYNQDYEEEAAITTEDVTFDYDDFDADLEIQDGYVVLGYEVTIENLSEDDLQIDAASFFISTTDGVFWTPDSSIVRSAKAIKKVPDLSEIAADPIAPGDSITGFISFSTFDTQTPDNIFYLPDSFRLVRTWDNPDREDGGDASPTADDEEDNGGLGPIGGEKKTPKADDDNKKTPEADTDSSGDCAGAADYQDATLANLDAWSQAINDADFAHIMTADPDDLRAIADDLSATAEDQANLDVPPAAEEFNDLLAQAFQDTADAIADIADGLENGDQVKIGEAASVISEVGSSFQSGDVASALSDLKDACTEIDQL
jgi:hypothetical protein